MKSDYDVMREALRPDELGGDATLSPLAMLLEELRAKVCTYFRQITDEAFLDWLERATPDDVSGEAGTGRTFTVAAATQGVPSLRTPFQASGLAECELSGAFWRP